jgi:hypothetical protein
MEYSGEVGERRAGAQQALIAIVWGLGQVIRWPLLTLLITLEPVARVVLGGIALLGTLTAFFFGAIHAPHFHFWGTLVFSQGCMGLLLVYYGVIRLLRPR